MKLPMKLKAVIFSIVFFNYNFLGSGYSGRVKIIEIEPFSKEFIKQFLRSNKILETDSDIEKYQELFDGNMKSIWNFVDSKKTLEGIVFYLIYYAHLKEDWITLEKESIQDVLRDMRLNQNCEDVNIILKQILDGKKQTGWTDEEKITNLKSFNSSRRILLENDLIIRRRRVEFKLKNGLTEEIIRKV